MNQLAQEFTLNADGLGTHSFKQLQRIGNVTIYERSKMDGALFGYETFVVKCKAFPDGNGGLGPEKETYPRSNTFGRTAYFCTTLDRAMERFAELLEKQG